MFLNGQGGQRPPMVAFPPLNVRGSISSGFNALGRSRNNSDAMDIYTITDRVPLQRETRPLVVGTPMVPQVLILPVASISLFPSSLLFSYSCSPFFRAAVKAVNIATLLPLGD